MADSYHSVTWTIPLAEAGSIPRDEDKLVRLQAIYTDRAYSLGEDARIRVDLGTSDLPIASAACVAWYAQSRRGLAGYSIDKLVASHGHSHALGFLGYTQFDLRFEKLGWGIGLVSILDDPVKVEAAVLALRALLEWCTTAVGATTAAKAIAWSGRSADTIREEVLTARRMRFPCPLELEDRNGDGYLFAYLVAMLATLEFAARTHSALIHINLIPR